MEKSSIKKVTMTQLILTIVYVFALLISNIVVVKQVDMPFGLSITSSMLLFPITYVLSDVFSEVYGYKWSRMSCHMAFALNAIMAIVFQITIWMPSASYWENQTALETILGNTPRILLSSFVALEVGDWVNDIVFKTMKKNKDGLQGFFGRAILSSVCGNVLDSIVFSIIAFVGEITISDIVIITLTEASLKTAYEILIYPITKFVAKKVKKAEAV